MILNNNFIILTSVVVLFTCFVTLCQLVLFLSSHSPLKHLQISPTKITNNFDSIWSGILSNSCLLILFVLQHSIQNKKIVKEVWTNLGYSVLERLFYNFGSCLMLQVLMRFWHPVSNWTIWEISTTDNNFTWWIFTSIHCIAWLLIYSGCFIMDITELLGLKQVYHSIQGWPEPLQLKSEELQRFYSHMRHPCFSPLTVILLIHPVMQIDRLLLACGFLVYMIAGLRVDYFDYIYQRRMLQRKERDLCN